MNSSAPSFNSDHARAVTYALERLRNELPPELLYHKAMHTEGDFLPLAMRLAQLSSRPKSSLHLVSCCLNRHEDWPLIDLADTSSLAGFQFCQKSPIK